MTNSPSRPPPGHPTSPQCLRPGLPARTGRVKARKRKQGGGQKGGGQPPRWRVCRAARPRARHSPARPLCGAGRNARGAGTTGPAAQPERVREGAGHPPAERRLRTGAQSWGGDSSASVINKAAHAREGGRAATPLPAGAALPQRPRAPTGGARLPALRPGPRGRAERGKFPGRPPSPGCNAARSSRSSPRPATSGGTGRAAPPRTAQLGSGLRLPRPPPARRGPPPRSAPLRPPARRGSVRAHLAGLPSLSGTLRSRTRPRPQPGPDSQPGKGAEARTSQRAPGQAGDTPPSRPPRARPPSPGAARARRPRASRRPHAPAPPPPPHSRRAPGVHTPAASRQWALNKCPSDSSRTCALEPDRVVTPPLPPTTTPKSDPAAAAPNQT